MTQSYQIGLEKYIFIRCKVAPRMAKIAEMKGKEGIREKVVGCHFGNSFDNLDLKIRQQQLNYVGIAVLF